MVADAARYIPGLALLFLLVLLARGLSELTGVNELFLAIGIGFFVANSLGVPDRFRSGIKTHKTWLAAGIVLLGASITIESIVDVGAPVLVLTVGTVTVTIVVAELMARNIGGVTERFGSMLAAGAGICGVSAVAAVGGAIRARETQIAYAAGVVLLMDAITLVVYPVVGSVLGLSDIVFGVWVGVSMLSTGPAVAVGFAHSEVAGQWATMTKLARNTLIGVVALGYASYYVRRGSGSSPSMKVLWSNFPKFVLGFLGLLFLASVGAFSADQQDAIANTVSWLFLFAFVGLGTEIEISALRRTGFAPTVVVFTAVIVASLLSLLVALAIL